MVNNESLSMTLKVANEVNVVNEDLCRQAS